MKKQLKAFMKNNKGFTLVEMIVVIAIIAIITVALVPTFLGYVEKSREATDNNAIYEVAHAAETAYVSTEDKDNNSFDVYIQSKGKATYIEQQVVGITTSSENTLAKRVDNIIDDSSYVYKSKKFRNKTITITVNKETGVATVGFSADENEDYVGKTYVLGYFWGRPIEFVPEEAINDLLAGLDRYDRYIPGEIPESLTPEMKETLNQKIYEATKQGEEVKETVKEYAVELGVPEWIVNIIM